VLYAGLKDTHLSLQPAGEKKSAWVAVLTGHADVIGVEVIFDCLPRDEAQGVTVLLCQGDDVGQVGCSCDVDAHARIMPAAAGVRQGRTSRLLERRRRARDV
jgi:hypothetical protein